jgi:hypothetical protein
MALSRRTLGLKLRTTPLQSTRLRTALLVPAATILCVMDMNGLAWRFVMEGSCRPRLAYSGRWLVKTLDVHPVNNRRQDLEPPPE